MKKTYVNWHPELQSIRKKMAIDRLERNNSFRVLPGLSVIYGPINTGKTTFIKKCLSDSVPKDSVKHQIIRITLSSNHEVTVTGDITKANSEKIKQLLYYN